MPISHRHGRHHTYVTGNGRDHIHVTNRQAWANKLLGSAKKLFKTPNVFAQSKPGKGKMTKISTPTFVIDNSILFMYSTCLRVVFFFAKQLQQNFLYLHPPAHILLTNRVCPFQYNILVP